MKNTKTKMILGCLGLTVFAVVVTTLIIKSNARQAEAKDEVEYGTITEQPAQEPEEAKETLTFPDTRGFTEEDLKKDEDEPEGKEYYGDDEQEPMYHVMISNFEELYTKYNDWKICNELPYYLHTYFNLCTGNLDEMYEVTLTQDSCICSEDTSLVTLEATVDKYPGMVIFIEYDKLDRVFGIKSDLGDYSLEALRERGEDNTFKIDYEIEDDIEYENAEQATNAEVAEDD